MTTILTDHESLKYMNSVSKPSKRLARWIDEFQGYNLDIRYRRGRDAIVPDALRRRPDYFNHIANEKYISYIKQFLFDGTLPNEAEMRERVMSNVSDCCHQRDWKLLEQPMSELSRIEMLEMKLLLHTISAKKTGF